MPATLPPPATPAAGTRTRPTGSSGATPPSKLRKETPDDGMNCGAGSSAEGSKDQDKNHNHKDSQDDSSKGKGKNPDPEKKNLFEPGGTAAVDSGGRRRRQPTEGVQNDKQLLKLLVKMNLKMAQEMRTVSSAVFEVYLLKAESIEIQRLNTEMVRYTEATKGKPGHQLGPPHIWAYGALLAALESRGKEVGAKTASEVAELYKQYGEIDEDMKNDWIKVCRVEKVYAKDMRRLLLSYGTDMPGKRTVAQALVQTGAVRKTGRAPEGGMEVALQQWLEKT